MSIRKWFFLLKASLILLHQRRLFSFIFIFIMKSNFSHSRFTSPFSWLLPSLLWTLPPSMRSGLSTTEMLPAPRLLTSRYSCDCGECLYCLCTCVVYHFMSTFSGAPVARPHREVLQPRRKIDCRDRTKADVVLTTSQNI